MNQKRMFCVVLCLMSFSVVGLDALEEKVTVQPVLAARISSKVSPIKTMLLKRNIVRAGVYAGGAVAALLLLRISLDSAEKVEGINQSKIASSEEGIQEETKEEELQAKAYLLARALLARPKIEKQGFWEWVRSFPKGIINMSKILATGFIANKLLGNLWEKAVSVIHDPIEEETVLWYLNKKTFIVDMFEVLKINSIPLDMDSFYLDFEINQRKQNVALNKFVNDVAEAVNHGNVDILRSLSGRMNRLYAGESKYLKSLEDDALVVQGLKRAQEFVVDGANDYELAQKAFSRTIIQSTAQKFRVEVEKLLAFIIARYDEIDIEHEMIRQVISLTNEYLHDVEELLNMSVEDLSVASKQSAGFFTKVFNFQNKFNGCLKSWNRSLQWS